jgi:serine/threonine protein kinase
MNTSLTCTVFIAESLLRRIFSELCKAVGWMHGVGLVHRDIKLESQLFDSEELTKI